jgi:hypothetical protein
MNLMSVKIAKTLLNYHFLESEAEYYRAKYFNQVDIHEKRARREEITYEEYFDLLSPFADDLENAKQSYKEARDLILRVCPAYFIHKNEPTDTAFEIHKVPETVRSEETGKFDFSLLSKEEKPKIGYQKHIIVFTPDEDYRVVNLTCPRLEYPSTYWESGEWVKLQNFHLHYPAITDEYIAVYPDETIRPLTIEDVMATLGDSAEELTTCHLDIDIRILRSKKNRAAVFDKIIKDMNLPYWCGYGNRYGDDEYSEKYSTRWKLEFHGPKWKILEAIARLDRAMKDREKLTSFYAPHKTFNEDYLNYHRGRID